MNLEVRGDGRARQALVRMELMAGEEANAIAEAVQRATPSATVTEFPGYISIAAPGRLEFECREVADYLGRAWGPRDLQVIMANYAGYITRMDEERIELQWHEATATQSGVERKRR